MSLGSILLVEDDENLGYVTKDSLTHQGYQVIWAKDGIQGFHYFSEMEFDLCLLDVMMPNMDGFELASKIRSKNEFIPILFLTARSMEEDRLRGFEIGGDDYITKPFSLTELIYRVKVFLRRSKIEEKSENKVISYSLGSFNFDYGNLVLSDNDTSVNLTQMEADLLKMLLLNKNQLVSRENILVKIWGENDYFKGRSLDVFISRLRKYVKKDTSIEIKNHHSVGFMLKVNQ